MRALVFLVFAACAPAPHLTCEAIIDARCRLEDACAQDAGSPPQSLSGCRGRWSNDGQGGCLRADYDERPCGTSGRTYDAAAAQGCLTSLGALTCNELVTTPGPDVCNHLCK